MATYKHYLFDWGNTLMVDFPAEKGPMYLWQHVEAVNGASSLLRESSNIADLHITTNAKNSTMRDIRTALKRVDLATYIKEFFCFKGIGFEKPSRGFFTHILSSLGCEKHEVIMDIYGALDAGIDAIWFNIQDQPVPYGIRATDSLLKILSL